MTNSLNIAFAKTLIFAMCLLPSFQTSWAEPVDLYVKGRAVPVAYQQQLASWLNKFQFYPINAKKLRLEGTVLVKVTIRYDGTVLQTALEKSSGSEILDGAALQLLELANPLPPFPENFESDEITFIAPISYSLKLSGGK